MIAFACDQPIAHKTLEHLAPSTRLNIAHDSSELAHRSWTLRERAEYATAQLAIRSDERRLGARDGCTLRCGIVASVTTPRALGIQRTGFATRRRATELGAEVEHGLIEASRITCWQERRGERSSFTATQGAILERSSEHPANIRVKHRDRSTE